MYAWHFKISLLCLGTNLISCSNSENKVAVTSLRDLLRDINYKNYQGNCDVQLIHSGDVQEKFSLTDVNTVSTTIFMPKYEFLYTNIFTLPAVDILNSRLPKCKLSFILLRTGRNETDVSVLNQIVHWIEIVSIRHMYYKDRNDWTKTFIANTNAVITLLSPRG